MNLLVTGLNHNTAPIDIREQVAMTGGVLPEALQELSLQPGVNEAMIVSTCNRVELLCPTANTSPISSSSFRSVFQPVQPSYPRISITIRRQRRCVISFA
jgi:glutamyl-tRNA reductase